MKRIKLMAILLVLSLLLSACGAATSGTGNAGDYVAKEEAVFGRTENDGQVTTETALPVNQKLIRKVWMDAETEDMDDLLSVVTERIGQLGGYVEARQIQNGSAYSGKRYRHADLTIRIPAERLAQFLERITAASNITSTRETTEDVTLSYVEYESKVAALETEQARLLELLAQAETMDDILKIENRLTGIRTQLEQAKSQLRLYDSLVNYSTVYLNVTEVTEYTPVEEPKNMWERMGAGLEDSWDSMVEILEEILILLVVLLPYLLPLAVIAAFVLSLIFFKRRKRRKQAKKEETVE